MTFCLNTKIVKPEEGEEIKNAVILLHGYGANGAMQDFYLGLSTKVNEKNYILVIPFHLEQLMQDL